MGERGCAPRYSVGDKATAPMASVCLGSPQGSPQGPISGQSRSFVPKARLSPARTCSGTGSGLVLVPLSLLPSLGGSATAMHLVLV